MNDFKPGDRVYIVSGEYRGRRGTVTDHIHQLKAFDAVVQPGEIADQLRRQYEVPSGKLAVRLDPSFAAGLNWCDAHVEIVNLRPGIAMLQQVE